MSHRPHPGILEHGLADGCPRCSEIAADPVLGLDNDTLADLIGRTRRWMCDTDWPRSGCEHTAMVKVAYIIDRANRINTLSAPSDRSDGPASGASARPIGDGLPSPGRTREGADVVSIDTHSRHVAFLCDPDESAGAA